MSKKKIHRFLIESITNTVDITITDPRVVHQITHVLRLRPGEEVIIFESGGPDVQIRILETDRHKVIGEKIETFPLRTAPRRTIIAAISIIKHDRFEMIVQKLTELGVSEIIPLITDRTIKQSLRIDRLQSISDEALEQCGGNNRVTIYEPVTLNVCLAQHSAPSYVLVPGTEENILQPLPDTLMFYVGPEGGWTENEERMFTEHNVIGLNLGPRILRAETAAIVGSFKLLQ